VKAGETVEITERGKLIAVLGPCSREISALDRLIAEGKIIPAKGPRVLPEPIKLPPGSPTLSEILDQQREERLF